MAPRIEPVRVLTSISTDVGAMPDYCKTLALNYMREYKTAPALEVLFELTSPDFIHVFADWRKTLTELNSYARPFNYEFVIQECWSYGDHPRRQIYQLAIRGAE